MINKNTTSGVWAMVLAAGRGTRLKQLTETQPKALVKVNGKPLIELVLNNLREHGFTHVVINLHHFGDQIIDFVSKNPMGLNIYFSDESKQLLDTGGALLKALPYFPSEKPVLVHNVDIISNLNLNELREKFIQSGTPAALVVQDRPSSRKLLFNDHQQLIGWKNEASSEFKWANDPHQSYHSRAFSGIHFFYPELFKPFTLESCSIIDIYLKLARNHRIIALPANNNLWFDLGKIEHLAEIESQLKANTHVKN